MNPVLHSSKADDWRTPASFLTLVRKVNPIVFDPATSIDNPCRAAFYMSPGERLNVSGVGGIRVGNDGLDRGAAWKDLIRAGHIAADGVGAPKGLTYVNPPYGRSLGAWAERIVEHLDETIVLVPARSDTRWFRKLWLWCDCVCFLSGRLRFERPESTGVKEDPAPFPSAVFYRARRYPGERVMGAAKVPELGPFTSVFSGEGLIAVPTDA